MDGCRSIRWGRRRANWLGGASMRLQQASEVGMRKNDLGESVGGPFERSTAVDRVGSCCGGFRDVWGGLERKAHNLLSSVKSWQWTELANRLRQVSDRWMSALVKGILR